MFPMNPDAAERLARRYPSRRTPVSNWRAWAVLAAAVGLAWLAWAAFTGANPPVTARVDSFEVVSNAEIDVRITVDRPDPRRPAECSLFAQAVTYERVAELVVQIPPGTERLTTHDVALRTFKRATTADIESCRVTG